MNAPTLFAVDDLETQGETQRAAFGHDHTIDRLRVLAVLAQHPEGLTDWELADRIDPFRKPSIGKRRADLKCVKVRDAEGTPITRVSHGSRCFVWRLPV